MKIELAQLKEECAKLRSELESEKQKSKGLENEVADLSRISRISHNTDTWNTPNTYTTGNTVTDGKNATRTSSDDPVTSFFKDMM